MHLVAVAVHDEGLLAGDRMAGQGSVSKPDTTRLIDHGHYLNGLEDSDAEEAHRDNHVVALDHRRR